jgi:hypothetical protein
MDLDTCWRMAWRDLQNARRRRSVEGVAALGAEIVNLASVLKSRVRRWQRRQRGKTFGRD